jgi:gamma-glutamyltranspeptidase/glutathione hydrolase
VTFTTRPTLTGTFGMVSSTHWLASQSAQRMLELGGNAFDAAVAGGFVLHVVEPHLNGPGGDMPAGVSTAADPAPKVRVPGRRCSVSTKVCPHHSCPAPDRARR